MGGLGRSISEVGAFEPVVGAWFHLREDWAKYLVMTDPFIVRMDPPLRAVDQGPLADLTLAVKDIFDLAGYPTLNGLKDWPDPAPKRETAPLVQRLMDLGMQVAGKVITEQLAHSTIGINPDYGTPPNVRHRDRVPGGSSSGSGSAVALGLCDVGLGSDTGGSVRIPAAYQGIWGLRPTLGTLPLDGAMELAPSFDTPGFLTRDLSTLRRVHQALDPSPAKTLTLRVPTAVWAFYDLPVPIRAPAVDLPWDQAMATRISRAFRFAQAREVTERLGHLADDERLNLHPMIRERLRWNRNVTLAQKVEAFAAIEPDLARLREILAEGTALVWPTIAELPPLIEVGNTWGEAKRAQQFALTAPAGLLSAPQLHCPVGTLGFSLIGTPGTDLDLLETAQNL